MGAVTTATPPASAVSWAAIIGGAFVAAAMTVLLGLLGAGIGFASVSPFGGSGVSATSFTVLTAIWLIVTQWIAMFFGGYLTGRLRTRWHGLHGHEVFFRDTAHGFLTWAVSAVLLAVVLGSGASALIGGGVRAAGGAASSAVQGAAQGGAQGGGYYADMLFRSANPTPGTQPGADRGEALRIMAMALQNGAISPGDKTYLGQMIASKAGISQPDAEKRIDDVLSQEKAAAAKVQQTADAARKAASAFSFYTFFSMLVGAFIACVAAAIGGTQRDEH